MTLANINEIIYITDTFLLKSLWINNQCGIFMSQIYFQWEKILNGINKRFII